LPVLKVFYSTPVFVFIKYLRHVLPVRISSSARYSLDVKLIAGLLLAVQGTLDTELSCALVLIKDHNLKKLKDKVPFINCKTLFKTFVNPQGSQRGLVGRTLLCGLVGLQFESQ
jgi:hypothetical protein